MKPAVARAALEAGASIVNDVAANRENDCHVEDCFGISRRLYLYARTSAKSGL